MFQKNSNKKIVFRFSNVYFFCHSLYNLVSLEKLNSNYIFYNNENKTLYYIKIWKIFIYAQY